LSSIVKLDNVTKVYVDGPIEVKALKGVSLKVEHGEFLCVMGPSGSGKTTLLNIISTLDKPTSGRVEVCGVDITSMPEKKLARFRLRNIGIIFQFHNLIPELTALDNVALPAIISGASVKEGRRKARKLLDMLGLSHREKHRPPQLSGGERQRIAIARALINEPKLLVCDEPTGNLDYKSKVAVLDLIKRINREHGTTVIVVTHDPLVARYSSRNLRLIDGRIK